MSDLPMQEKVNGSCVDSKEKGGGKGHTLETVRNNVEHFIQRRAIKACVCVCMCVRPLKGESVTLFE